MYYPRLTPVKHWCPKKIVFSGNTQNYAKHKFYSSLKLLYIYKLFIEIITINQFSQTFTPENCIGHETQAKVISDVKYRNDAKYYVNVKYYKYVFLSEN